MKKHETAMTEVKVSNASCSYISCLQNKKKEKEKKENNVEYYFLVFQKFRFLSEALQISLKFNISQRCRRNYSEVPQKAMLPSYIPEIWLLPDTSE